MRGLKLLSALLFLLIISSYSEAFNWPHWGRCKDIPVVQHFNLTKYQGQWFEQAGYRTWLFEGDKRCVYANYYVNKTDGLIYIQNHGISNKDNQWGGVNGTATFTDPSTQEAKLTATFNIPDYGTVKGPYWALGTDYDTFAVVYSCKNFLFFFHYYTVWFLSRKQTFDTTSEQQSYFNNAYSVLNYRGIDTSVIRSSSQFSCNVSNPMSFTN